MVEIHHIMESDKIGVSRFDSSDSNKKISHWRRHALLRLRRLQNDRS